MVSKNNNIKKVERVAERQPSFGIRKLTVGAVSVLLGTTLWLSNNATVAKADTNSADDKAESQDNTVKSVNAAQAKKAVVVAQVTVNNENKQTATNSTTQTSTQSNENSKSDTTQSSNTNSKDTDAKQTQSLKQNNGQYSAKNESAYRNKSASSEVTSKNVQTQLQKAATNTAQKQAEQRANKDIATQKATASKIQKAAQDGQKNSKNENTITAAALKGTQTSQSNDSKTAIKADNSTTNFNAAQISALTAANTDLNKELGASLIDFDDNETATLDGLVEGANALIKNVNAQVVQKVDTSKFKTVTNGNDLVSAINSWDTSIQGVNVQGNINLTGAVWGNTLTINKNFYINGLDNATINLGQVSLNNNANLTLANVTVNGSIKGNGSVVVKGDVTSNVDYSNNATLSDSELNTQVGSSHPGVNTNNWKAANIAASRVVIDPEASLTVNRNIDGDGIVLMNGGALFGQNVGTNGALVANYNSKLTINLKDWQTASRANEQATNIENANTGIRAVNNGHVVTGDSAEININAGHGRAIMFNEPFGGNGSIHQKSNLETNWYNNRSISRNFNYAMDTNNSVIFGDSNKVHVTGRDGILFGNRGNFVTGEHSIVRIDSKGNGAGLLGDAFSSVEVSPQSQLLLTSDGKNASGQWSGGNFIGLGENGQFRVEHDATFRYKMINRGGNDGNYYDDNMNIISTNPQSHPEVYVGTNATFDGQSDYSNYYGEIFSFPLGSTNTVFQIDGSKYVNWERNAVSTKPGPNGNLYYSMGKSLIDATSAQKGRSYYVFKWYNQYFNGQDLTFNDENSDAVKQSLQGFIDTSSEYWKNVTHLATSYSKNGNTAEFPGHFVTGIDMNGDATPGQKHGTPLNDFSGGNDGFDPHSSQRLVLVATIIPVQEDKTEQVKTPFKIQVHENKDLKPGEVKLVQQGQDGLVRKTTTTYYNVDPSSGEKTIDTSKGTNGVKTTTTVISEEQDEIIDIGPQTAYIKYLYQNNDTNQTDPIQVDGQNLQAAISAIPVATDSQGNIIFTENGDVTANTIDYSDVQDLQKGKEAVSQQQKINIDDVQVLENQWEQAVKDKTNKYNVTGLTRDAIVAAAEKAGLNNPVVVGPTEGPTFKVILGEKAQDQTAQVIYRDVQNPASPVQLATSGELSGKPGTPINYSTSQEIQTLESKGYVLTKDGYPANATFTNQAETYYVDFVHGAVPVTPNTPSTDIPKTPDGKQLVDPTTLTKDVTLTVDYVNNDGTKFTGEIPMDAKQTITFTGSAYIDRVTGQIVNAKKDGDNWVANGAGQITWTPESSSFKAVISPTETNYHVVNVSDYRDGNNVAVIPDITKDSKDIKVTVTYAPDGQSVINQKSIPSTQTVKFLEEGTDKQLLDPNKQAFTFTYSGDTINSETKEVIKKGSWNAESHTYDTVNVPVIDGYVAVKGYVTKDGKVVAGGLTATQSDPDVQAIVYYAKVGKIVPVDPGHTPIPDTPTPTYKNDPDNPTKVVPNEPVPEVPGYTPEVPNVTPEDPTKDTPVVYNKDAQDQTAEVIYQDINDPSKPVQLATSGKLTGKVGNKIDYSTTDEIKILTDKGYVLVKNGFPTDAIYQDTNKVQTYYVTFKHGTVPVNPDNPGKPGEPINPNDPDGPKYPADTEKSALTKTITRTINYVDNSGKVISKPVTQTVDFTKSGVLDKVTGKWITPLTWDSTSKEISEVTSPTVPDYHIVSVSKDKDGDNVKAVTIIPSESSYDVTVTYAPDGQSVINQKSIPSKQTIKFVDTDGKELSPDKVSDFTFTYSGDTINSETKEVIKKGTWNAETHTYDTVNVPVIDGYVAVKGYVTKDGKVVAGGLTATQDKPDVEAVVVYAKIGKIVPVDPGHTPIPDTPTPTYKNDPDNPTKVVPNEPVPEVPGYTPEVPNVTPKDPTKDTQVVYKKNPEVQDQTAEVIYQDVNDPSNVIQLATSGILTGKAGTRIDYSTKDEIAKLTNEGYVLVTNGFPSNATYDDKKNIVQKFYVTFKHGTVPVNPENPGKPGEPINPNDPTGPKYPEDSNVVNKTVTRTIEFVNEKGQPVAKDIKQSVNFTASGVLDKVTGKWITPLTWSPNQEISEEKVPFVENYHVVSINKDADGKIAVKAVTLTHDDTSYTVKVTYAPNGHIIPVDPNGKQIPNAPTPQYPTSPDNPADVTPNEPVPTIPGYTPTVPTVTPQNPGKDTPVIYTPVDDMEHAIVIYQDVNNPNHPVQLASSGDLTGKAGTVINYSTKEEITQLIARGYVLKSDGFASGVKFDSDKNKVQTFYVNFVHGTQPVNPDNPGKPGEPINPEDPNGPKYPAGSNIVSRDVTRTIDYVDQNGKEMPGHSPIVQTAHFTGSGVLDKVTGQWITPITWSGDGNLAGETSPVISGFHIVRVSQDSTNNINVDPTVVKYNTDSYKVSVVYAPNGHIVPVDPNGKPIPNAPTPQYPTSPDNPADVTPNEPVPTIPGFTPETPTITPQNPGTNTPVIYTPDAKMQTAIVNYVDSDDHDAIIATSGDITGKPGTVIDYSTKKELTILSDKGYVLVHNGFDPDGVSPKFDSDSSTVQTYTVVLKHGIVTVTPNDPGHPGEPINPNDPNGPKWPTDTGKDSLEKVATQTIKYVGAGDNTPKDNVQKFTFTKKMVIDKVTGKVIETGAWNDTSHTFGSVDTPVVDGYHADKRVAGGTTVTPTDLNKTITVVYTKNGKIIPVDPNGKPIPNASTPTYKTDPNDPTQVVPDEPVPTVPNMVPSQTTVTPQNPAKDTPVVYNYQQGSVVIVVHDITTDTNLPQYGYNSKTVDEGTKVDYDWTKTKQELENHGYEIVSQNISIPTVVGKTAQTITIDVKHATAPVGPDNPHEPGTPINPNDPSGPKWPAKDTYTKHYTSTIHFVDSEGKALEKDSVQTSTWTRTIIVDKVTGKILNDNESWKPNITTYAPTTVPVIKGYVADKKSKDGVTVGTTLPGSKVVQKDIQDSIIYNKIGKIVPVDPSGNQIPGAITPEYKNDPSNPTAVIPNEPVPNIPGYTPEEKTVTPVDPTKDTKVVYTKPSTPVTPVTPDVPATPENPTSPVAPSPAPHPQTPSTPEPTPEPEAVKPHPQTVPTKPQTQPQTSQKETTVKPHPQTVETKVITTPTTKKVAEKKVTSNPVSIQQHAPIKAQQVSEKAKTSSLVSTSTAQRTLPQTGENNDENATAAILGAAATGLSMIGLAGVKRRRRNR
ncbi:YSIRK-type signal peptide-containing protein [Lactobacillus sp. LL6]|uniref:mucin-binding protein n=1 Tax=Lactobacillus sp. LL6 TaxID=2596827 RepID=UPI0011868159|nr:YSIRK-type signal peptide-containing protein [Lactobacillus sp. LL6]TSO26649.1 YSIRK-type signal peptide-containing protein [Lactobacillus sp. LL6]